MLLGRVTRPLAIVALVALAALSPLPIQSVAVAAPTVHRHFKTAIYIAVGDVKQLADRATFDGDRRAAIGTTDRPARSVERV